MQAHKKILVAEDDKFSQMSLKAILRHLPVDPTITNDGQEAVLAYKSHGGFPIILMDIQMPNMDGYEATREIRKTEAASRLPAAKILGLSADDDEDTVSEAFRSGMNGMLKKPLKKEELAKHL